MEVGLSRSTVEWEEWMCEGKGGWASIMGGRRWNARRELALSIRDELLVAVCIRSGGEIRPAENDRSRHTQLPEARSLSASASTCSEIRGAGQKRLNLVGSRAQSALLQLAKSARTTDKGLFLLVACADVVRHIAEPNEAKEKKLRPILHLHSGGTLTVEARLGLQTHTADIIP